MSGVKWAVLQQSKVILLSHHLNNNQHFNQVIRCSYLSSIFTYQLIHDVIVIIYDS